MRSMKPSDSSITRLLDEARNGDVRARQGLIVVTYDHLRQMARGFLRGERRHHTLGATELVHEIQIRLLGRDEVPGRHRGEFYRYVGLAMRHLLVDYARSRRRREPIQRLEERPDRAARAEIGSREYLVEIGEALERLEKLDERKCRVVELRFFAGLEGDEVAEALGVSPSTVDRDWRVARRWLYKELIDG